LLLLAAVLALTVFGTAVIEAPGSVHKFYGFGSESSVDGVTMDEGAINYAWNQRDVLVGTGVLRDGLWDFDVAPGSATAVRFSIDGSGLSGWNDVNVGSLTELSLALPGSAPALSVGARLSPLPDREGFQQYTILQGDTLRRIAERFDLTVDEIMAANPQLANANQIRLGNPLLLPEGATLTSGVAVGDASNAGVGNGAEGAASTETGIVPQDGDAAGPLGVGLPPLEDSDFWAWLAIGASIAAMVIGLSGLFVACRRRLRAERRELAHAAVPAALAPDLTPPPVYRTLVRDRAQATVLGPFDTTSAQTEGVGQPETFGGGD